MKKQIFTLLLLFAFFVMAFIPKDKGKTDECGFNIKTIDKSVVKITDSLYAGKYEVSNVMYLMFQYDLKKNNKMELLEFTRPDTMNWLDKSYYDEPLVELYLRHPAYGNYPVVNISYEDANIYCAWLTDRYNADPKRNFKKVLFRLPTEKEWETAAKGGNDISLYPWGDRLILNDKSMCNYKRIGDEFIKHDSLTNKIIVDRDLSWGIAGSLNDGADMTAPVDSYNPNSYGLYNVCGNVAEMVQAKGISRGGSWKSTGAEVRIKSRAHYDKTATDLGFRYFMQVIEK
jgi:sulfatase modifying factor 1